MKKRFMLSAAGVSVAAIAGFAPADIVVDVAEVSLLGGEFVYVDLGDVSGTLTGISYSYAWSNNEGDSSWSSDMLIGVTNGGVSGSATVSVGGYNLNFGGSSWGGLNGSAGTGTYSGSASGSMAMSGAAGFYWANGWSTSAGTTSSGTFTLHGIGAAVPAPGALALLGLAGIASRRRRK